jgi:hypothetical protein
MKVKNDYTPMWAAELEEVAPRPRNTTPAVARRTLKSGRQVGCKRRLTGNGLTSDAARVDAVLSQSRSGCHKVQEREIQTALQ